MHQPGIHSDIYVQHTKNQLAKSSQLLLQIVVVNVMADQNTVFASYYQRRPSVEPINL